MEKTSLEKKESVMHWERENAPDLLKNWMKNILWYGKL
jgi:hypothetical protein